MKKKPKQLKEFLEREKIKNKYDEKIIVKNESIYVLTRTSNILFYISIIVLSSIGATYIVNNFDKFNF